METLVTALVIAAVGYVVLRHFGIVGSRQPGGCGKCAKNCAVRSSECLRGRES